MKRIEPKTSKGPAEWFTGDVYPTIVLAGEEPSRVRMGSVHFSPCARTAWHSHVTDTAPGVEHWHGASPDSFMVHYALWEAAAPGGTEPETTWGEHVTDEEYGK
jgi:quercetin dioxygenase-like cupin family protein